MLPSSASNGAYRSSAVETLPTGMWGVIVRALAVWAALAASNDEVAGFGL